MIQHYSTVAVVVAFFARLRNLRVVVIVRQRDGRETRPIHAFCACHVFPPSSTLLRANVSRSHVCSRTWDFSQPSMTTMTDDIENGKMVPCNTLSSSSTLPNGATSMQSSGVTVLPTVFDTLHGISWSVVYNNMYLKRFSILPAVPYSHLVACLYMILCKIVLLKFESVQPNLSGQSIYHFYSITFWIPSKHTCCQQGLVFHQNCKFIIFYSSIEYILQWNKNVFHLNDIHNNFPLFRWFNLKL